MAITLCLDAGNTHVFGGVFNSNSLCFKFRYPTEQPFTSDQIGLFLIAVLKENAINPTHIQAIAMSSVVPSIDYSIRSACIKYLNCEPFQLKPGVKTGLKLAIKNPIELGSDRIANAVAALAKFPNENITIADFGTATTLCAISKDKIYLGGAIMPGFKMSAYALNQHTAKLPVTHIIKPEKALGTCTIGHIQSGLYYSQLGAIKELIHRFKQSIFKEKPPIALSTGGYAYLFKDESVFLKNLPDLTLEGLKLLLEKNLPHKKIITSLA